MPNFDAFVNVLAQQPERNATLVGKVASINPMVINFRGALLKNLGRPSWYTPAVGDVVTLDRQSQSWMCTGRVVAT